jgi:hypothetical protein
MVALTVLRGVRLLPVKAYWPHRLTLCWDLDIVDDQPVRHSLPSERAAPAWAVRALAAVFVASTELGPCPSHAPPSAGLTPLTPRRPGG